MHITVQLYRSNIYPKLRNSSRVSFYSTLRYFSRAPHNRRKCPIILSRRTASSTIIPAFPTLNIVSRKMATDPAAAAALIEKAKRTAGFSAVEQHFSTSFKYVGIGSGSTIRYVVEAIKVKVDSTTPRPEILYVPTGAQSRLEIVNAGLTPLAFEQIPEDVTLDVAFDGADECDDDLNLVKGGGACLFQEKLVATRAKEFVCVADYRKDVKRLLTGWTYIPIEVAPISVASVIASLRVLGSPNPTLRAAATPGTGALLTDQAFNIVMAPFPPLLTRSDPKPAADATAKCAADGALGKVWQLDELATAIKLITGVLDVGLFVGVNGHQAQKLGGQGGQKPVAVYFGLADGTVKVRKANETL